MASVLVPLAPGCEELEAVTIIDLLRRAGIEVVAAGLEAGPVRASRGVVLVPDLTLDEALAHDYDAIVLPGGGPGSDALAADPRIKGLLGKMAAADRLIGAICAAPKVLAGAGLLKGRSATSYPGVLEALGDTTITLRQEPVVRDGQLITSRGPGTAMAFALTLIEALAGREMREQVDAGLVRPTTA